MSRWDGRVENAMAHSDSAYLNLIWIGLNQTNSLHVSCQYLRRSLGLNHHHPLSSHFQYLHNRMSQKEGLSRHHPLSFHFLYLRYRKTKVVSEPPPPAEFSLPVPVSSLSEEPEVGSEPPPPATICSSSLWLAPSLLVVCLQ